MTLGKGHQKVYGIDRPLKIIYSHVLTETIPPPPHPTQKNNNTHTHNNKNNNKTASVNVFSHHEIRKNVKLATTEHRASTTAICSHVKGLTLIKQKLTEKYYFRGFFVFVLFFSLSLFFFSFFFFSVWRFCDFKIKSRSRRVVCRTAKARQVWHNRKFDIYYMSSVQLEEITTPTSARRCKRHT